MNGSNKLKGVCKSQLKKFDRVNLRLSGTISTWASHAMAKLGYAATPSTGQHTGRRQLAFNSLIFVFSLVLLPGLWHRYNCLVKIEQPVVKSLVFGQLWISHNRRQCKQTML